ncbi:RimK/LysX family protein [Patescibacteria group bacterium]|nr:RimK/LysX family protein [Patescibacteria group bacterium]
MSRYFTKTQQVLGINERNIKYIKPSNNKRAIRVADNKLLTKRILVEKSIPIAKTFAIARNRNELINFNWDDLPKSFVLKPNRGTAGDGVMILYGKIKKKKEFDPFVWVKADKTRMNVSLLQEHTLNILDGQYSKGQLPDSAIFEERLKLLRIFKPYSYRGVPDIRVIVYNSIPVMAELRLPTKESDGRSNLHLGGIGVGIDMATGTTTSAVHHGKIIKYLPDTKLPLSGIKIPEWRNILELAIECQHASKVGFLGVDIGMDREKGPVVLELNARPGLSIQLANLSPLGVRLEKARGLKVKSVKQAIRLAQDLFGGAIEEELEELSGRRIIGIKEPIEIIDNKGEKHKTTAKIDTGAYRTSICSSLAKELGLIETVKYKKVRSSLGKEGRSIIDLSFILDKRTVSTEAFIADRQELKFDIIVGRKDLKKFLVDPSKNILLKE